MKNASKNANSANANADASSTNARTATNPTFAKREEKTRSGGKGGTISQYGRVLIQCSPDARTTEQLFKIVVGKEPELASELKKVRNGCRSDLKLMVSKGFSEIVDNNHPLKSKVKKFLLNTIAALFLLPLVIKACAA